MSDIVSYESDGRIALITLNRPDARNAINGDVAAGLEAAVDRMEDDPEVWVGILRANTEGQSNPVFCAGADLKAINSGQAGSLNTKRGGFAGFVYRERRKPIIVAVDGLATAGGCEIVLAADLVVATTRSAFGLASVAGIGQVAALAGSSADAFGTGPEKPDGVGQSVPQIAVVQQGCQLAMHAEAAIGQCDPGTYAHVLLSEVVRGRGRVTDLQAAPGGIKAHAGAGVARRLRRAGHPTVEGQLVRRPARNAFCHCRLTSSRLGHLAHVAVTKALYTASSVSTASSE